MKKILAGIMALTLVFSFTAVDCKAEAAQSLQSERPAALYQAEISGDLDKDGKVTIADVMEACKILARKSAGQAPTDDEKARGDLDGNGQVDISDVMEICKIIARKDTSPIKPDPYKTLANYILENGMQLDNYYFISNIQEASNGIIYFTEILYYPDTQTLAFVDSDMGTNEELRWSVYVELQNGSNMHGVNFYEFQYGGILSGYINSDTYNLDEGTIYDISYFNIPDDLINDYIDLFHSSVCLTIIDCALLLDSTSSGITMEDLGFTNLI